MPDTLSQATEAIEEIIAEFGVKLVVAACLRTEAGEEFGKMGGNATLRISQVILREIAFSRNPQLEAEVMALASGVLLSDDTTMTKLAEKHGVGKAMISQRVVKFCEENSLPPSGYMKSERARKTYSLTNQPRTA